jgi:hypothetical protein
MQEPNTNNETIKKPDKNLQHLMFTYSSCYLKAAGMRFAISTPGFLLNKHIYSVFIVFIENLLTFKFLCKSLYQIY